MIIYYYAHFDSYQCMIEASPSERPSAKQIFSHPVVCPSTQKSKVSLFDGLSTNSAAVQRSNNNIKSFVQAQLCKELNEEKFKNQLLTRFVVPKWVRYKLKMCNILSQETSGGLPAAGTNWKSQTFLWTKIKQKHEHCLTDLRCCSTILPILFSVNKIFPKLKVVPSVADSQCEIVLRTWPLGCYCAGDAIHPVLQKGVVWFLWLLVSFSTLI